jgi:hypothetical protein
MLAARASTMKLITILCAAFTLSSSACATSTDEGTDESNSTTGVVTRMAFNLGLYDAEVTGTLQFDPRSLGAVYVMLDGAASLCTGELYWEKRGAVDLFKLSTDTCSLQFVGDRENVVAKGDIWDPKVSQWQPFSRTFRRRNWPALYGQYSSSERENTMNVVVTEAKRSETRERFEVSGLFKIFGANARQVEFTALISQGFMTGSENPWCPYALRFLKVNGSFQVSVGRDPYEESYRIDPAKCFPEMCLSKTGSCATP